MTFETGLVYFLGHTLWYQVTWVIDITWDLIKKVFWPVIHVGWRLYNLYTACMVCCVCVCIECFYMCVHVCEYSEHWIRVRSSLCECHTCMRTRTHGHGHGHGHLKEKLSAALRAVRRAVRHVPIIGHVTWGVGRLSVMLMGRA